MSAEPTLASAAGAAASLDRRAFGLLLLLVLIALAPWPATLLAGLAGQATQSVDFAAQLFFTLSTAHVGLTFFFWFERRYRPHINGRPLFFYGWPAVVTIVSLGLVLLVGGLGARIVEIGALFWLSYHYAKQNWGLVSLSALATGAARLPIWLKHSYVAGSIGAALGALSLMDAADPWLRLLWQLGAVITWVSAALGLIQALAVVRAGTHVLNLALLATGALFFTPIYLLGPAAGLGMIATVHGLHYTVLMSGIGADRQQGAPATRLFLMAGLGLGLLLLYRMLTEASWWGDKAPLMATLYLCIQMSHFIADADLWRLSDPVQRKAIRESFPYLFAAPKPR
jgi:hypothetical protein